MEAVVKLAAREKCQKPEVKQLLKLMVEPAVANLHLRKPVIRIVAQVYCLFAKLALFMPS